MKEIIFQIAQQIEKRIGLKIEEDKYYLFHNRLQSLMSEYKLDSWQDVLDKIVNNIDQTFNDRVIDLITTHETRFFRDENIFEAFAKQIIPEWMQSSDFNPNNPITKRLNIWSSGCSTGQEAYSLAISIHEYCPKLVGFYSIHGTDISKDSVAKARQGEYTAFETSRGLNNYLLNKYFLQAKDKYSVIPKIKKNLTFSVQNLLTSNYLISYDIIFFRNVAIYFSEETKKKLYEKMKESLKNDGVLILGSAESIQNLVPGFIVRHYKSVHYYEQNINKVIFFRTNLE